MFDLDFRANNGLLFFPKQFNVGVINSLLRDVRLFPGVVQLSGCAEVHLSPSLAAGVRLFGCVAALVSNHLSLTICLVLHLSPKLFVSNRMSALVVVSCSFIMILFMFCFVLVSVLYCLCVFLLYQDKIMFHHGFLCFTTCLPLVSYFVSLLLSQIQLPLLVIHAVLSWHGPKIASIRSYYNHKHAFRYCNGYGRTVLESTGVYFFAVNLQHPQLLMWLYGCRSKVWNSHLNDFKLVLILIFIMNGFLFSLSQT